MHGRLAKRLKFWLSVVQGFIQDFISGAVSKNQGIARGKKQIAITLKRDLNRIDNLVQTVQDPIQVVCDLIH